MLLDTFSNLFYLEKGNPYVFIWAIAVDELTAMRTSM